MFTSIQFHITKQATHSYAGYNKNNTLYMVVSEPMYLRVVHTKYLRNMSKKQKGKKSRRLKAEMRA